ncbi:DUF6489 family protein [Nevskia sp.]|uniref:DUF6489 family protein n=1 Tax=Nevskia sp. TaxID=1929292 RepID=UPI0025DEB9BF|nr:DUF6489 family protein [Nevskia sp.]
MQIKIEIDVKPEELRRFLGLPDVAGLQEDLMSFVRDKLGAAAETLDPSSFVKENLQSLKSSAPWQRLMSATKVSVKVAEPAVTTGVRKARKVVKAAGATVTGKKATRRKAAAKKSVPKPSA